MNKNNFAQLVLQELENQGYTGQVSTVEKANGVKLTGITIRTDSNISPTVYIDGMEGLTVSEAADKVREIYEAHKTPDINIDWLHDFEVVAPMLRARLYNVATNADIFKAAPAPFDDLIIVPYISGIEVNGDASGAIKVTNDLLKSWNKTAAEVLEIAESNSKNDSDIISMNDFMRAQGFPVPPMDDDPMTIVTNTKRCFGAYAIIAALDDLKQRYNDGFIVLPSSVHEVIILTTTDVDGVDCDQLVNQVNDEVLDYQEQLSNHSYKVA